MSWKAEASSNVVTDVILSIFHINSHSIWSQNYSHIYEQKKRKFCELLLWFPFYLILPHFPIACQFNAFSVSIKSLTTRTLNVVGWAFHSWWCLSLFTGVMGQAASAHARTLWRKETYHPKLSFSTLNSVYAPFPRDSAVLTSRRVFLGSRRVPQR